MKVLVPVKRVVDYNVIEGVELYFVIELAGMKGVEIGDAVNAEHNHFAIERR